MDRKTLHDKRHGVPFSWAFVEPVLKKPAQTALSIARLFCNNSFPIIFPKNYLDLQFAYFFSVAIMIYLCNKYESIQDHWYPKDPQKRARIDQYLAWQHGAIRRNAAWIFGEKVTIHGS